MIVDFDEVFNDNSAFQQVPQEILELINQDLPSNFCCYNDSKRGIRVGPKTNHIKKKMILKVNYDLSDNELKNIFKDIPKEDWPEYLYRTQKRIPVKSVKIGDEEKQIPIEQILQNPLCESEKMPKYYMHPEPFPAPIPITLHSSKGNQIILNIKRQPHESMDEIMFSNVDFPALKVTIIINEKEIEKSKIKYLISPTKATSVSEAIDILNIFKGLYDGTTTINGQEQAISIINDNAYDKNQIEAALDLWTTLKKLEEILEVTFNPAAEFPHKDVVFLSELKVSLLEKKSLKWNHPFEHFHVGELDVKTYSIEDIIGKEKVSMKFFEGPINATLLDASFELYSETEMRDFIITGIEWDDESKTSGEIYISDKVSGNNWVFIRRYLTNKEADIMKLNATTK